MANGTTSSSLTACVSDVDTFIYLRCLSTEHRRISGVSRSQKGKLKRQTPVFDMTDS
jgi:hypothetical protein